MTKSRNLLDKKDEYPTLDLDYYTPSTQLFDYLLDEKLSAVNKDYVFQLLLMRFQHLSNHDAWTLEHSLLDTQQQLRKWLDDKKFSFPEKNEGKFPKQKTEWHELILYA